MKAIGRLRVRHGLVAAVVALSVVALMWVRISALPTPSEFELDGNAIVDGIGDDWANTVPPPPSAGSQAFASTFVADGSGNATIFTTGGSKDINDLTQWSFKDQLGGLPDKDNLTNAYAAAYSNFNDLTIIFRRRPIRERWRRADGLLVLPIENPGHRRKVRRCRRSDTCDPHHR